MTIFTKWLGTFSLFFLLGGLPVASFGQIWSESFETDGNGTRYTTTVAEFSDGFEDFFTRTDGSNITGGYNVSGADGDFFFAAQDIDGEGASATQSLTFEDIDIDGFSSLTFSLLAAEDDASDGEEDWDLGDHVRIFYSIDGSTEQDLIWFESIPDGDSFNAVPAQDTDFDGDGDGTEVTDDFQEFSAAIEGTGSTISIRVEFNLDSGDEDLAIDLLQLRGESEETGPVAPTAGALVISEIMQNPSAVGDGDGEYFEVYNPTSDPIELNGVVISDDGTNMHTISSSVVVPAGGYAVLANNGDSGTNGGYTVDYVYGASIGLGNGADEVVLTFEGTEIDRVNYDGGPNFPDPTGASMILNPNNLTAADNDSGENWCISTSMYGAGDNGTPGAANDMCPVDCAITNVMVTEDGSCAGSDVQFRIDFSVAAGSGQYEVFDTDNPSVVYGNFLFADPTGNFFINCTLEGPTAEGTLSVSVRDVNDNTCAGTAVTVNVPTCEELVCPEVGSLVITEIMQNPSEVSDSDGEYFEVYNASAEAIDLNGFVILDDGSDSHVIAESVVVPAGGYAVLGPNADMSTNGGVMVDYAYGGGWFLSNSSDEVLVSCDGTVIDAVRYDNGFTFPDPNGASMSLNPDFLNAVDNDEGANWCESNTTYGDGDQGTPGAANDACCETPTFECVDNDVFLDFGSYELSAADLVIIDNKDNPASCPMITFDTSFPSTLTCDDLGETVIVDVLVNTEFGIQSCVSQITVVDESGELPAPWQAADVGEGENEFRYEVCNDNNGEFTLTSGGRNFPPEDVSDNTGYIFQTLCGDGSITARVESRQGGVPGVAIRENTAAGAKMATLLTTINNNLYWSSRTETDANRSFTIFDNPFPRWVRLVRQGNYLIGYSSTTGGSFTFVGATFIPMDACVEVGLVVFSANNNPATGVFSNVTVTGGIGNPALSAEVQDALNGLKQKAGRQPQGAAADFATPATQQLGKTTLFPNPTPGELTVRFSQEIEGETIVVVRNQLGQALKQQRLPVPAVQAQLQVGDLPAGLYLLEVQGESGILETLRFTKQ